jgi:hypothetical protein
MLNKIVSGGQTGVDRAALDAAQSRDIDVDGWCPNGRRAEDGSIPERYPLRETPTEDYGQRTTWNVRDSDGTLIISDDRPLHGGTARTVEEARTQNKPLLHVRTTDPVPVEMIRAWREDNNVRILNVAGPRASEAQGIYERALDILGRFLDAELQEA